MNLSQQPEKICIHLEIPFPVAHGFAGAPESFSSRHDFEKTLQAYFYAQQLDAYAAAGEGSVTGGYILILTDLPARTLRALKSFLESYSLQGTPTDLLPFASLGWLDQSDNLWRSYHPLTTRPFWTLLAAPEKIAGLLEEGRRVKA